MLPVTYPARFFLTVPPVPPLFLAAFGLAAAAAAVALVRDPESSRAALTPLLFLQLLAASSSVAVPARRGHYDLLFTSGVGRLPIGLMHWAMSIAPGVVAWIVIAGLELGLRGAAPLSLSTGTIAAMALVSTVPWGATVPFPRLTAGIAWLLLLTVAWALMPPAWWGTWIGWLLCPWLLVGRRLSAGDAPLVLSATALALVAVLGALMWIRRMDVPLETTA